MMFDSPSTSSSSLDLDSYPGSSASLYDPVLIQPPDDLEPLPYGLSLLDDQKHLYSTDEFVYSGLELTVAPALMDPQPYRARVPDDPVVATTDDVPIIAPTPRHAYNQFEAVMGFDPDDLLSDQQSPPTQPPASVAPPQRQSQHRGTGTAVASAVPIPQSHPITPSRKRSHEMAFVQEDMHLAEGLAPGAMSRKRARRSSTLAGPLHDIQLPAPSTASHWNQSALWQHAQSAAYAATAVVAPRHIVSGITPTTAYQHLASHYASTLQQQQRHSAYLHHNTTRLAPMAAAAAVTMIPAAYYTAPSSASLFFAPAPHAFAARQ